MFYLEGTKGFQFSASTVYNRYLAGLSVVVSQPSVVLQLHVRVRLSQDSPYGWVFLRNNMCHSGCPSCSGFLSGTAFWRAGSFPRCLSFLTPQANLPSHPPSPYKVILKDSFCKVLNCEHLGLAPKRPVLKPPNPLIDFGWILASIKRAIKIPHELQYCISVMFSWTMAQTELTMVKMFLPVADLTLSLILTLEDGTTLLLLIC